APISTTATSSTRPMLPRRSPPALSLPSLAILAKVILAADAVHPLVPQSGPSPQGVGLAPAKINADKRLAAGHRPGGWMGRGALRGRRPAFRFRLRAPRFAGLAAEEPAVARQASEGAVAPCGLTGARNAGRRR